MDSDDFLQISLSGTDNKANLLQPQIKAFNSYINTLPIIVRDHFRMSGTISLNEELNGNVQFYYEFSFTNVSFEKKYLRNEGRTTPVYPKQCITDRTTYDIRMMSNIKYKQYYIKKDGTTSNLIDSSTGIMCLGSIPCMVGSAYCHLYNMDPVSRKNIGEDPEDFGGYFIVDGSQKAVLSTKNVIKNSPQFYKQYKKGVLVRCDITSQDGDNFGPSFYMVIRMLNTFGITIAVTIGKDAVLVLPFFILYHIFNIGSDKAIFDTVLPNFNPNDHTEFNMSKLFRKALTCNYLHTTRGGENNFMHMYYVDDKLIQSTPDLIIALAQVMNSVNTGATAKKFNINREEKKSCISAVLKKLDEIILPHIGVTENDRSNKLSYFGSLIKGIYNVYLGDSESNRNSFCNQVINDTQSTMVVSFKTLFNMTVATKIVNEILNKNAKDMCDIGNVIKKILNKSELGGALCKALKAGNKDKIKINKKPTTNRVITNTLDNMNECSKMNSLRLLQNTKTIGGKTNSAQLNSRIPHPTDISCRMQSAEGERAGQTTAYTLSTEISGLTYSKPIETIIMGMGIENLFKINMPAYSRVIFNGKPLGAHRNTVELYYKLRDMRRNGQIDRNTSVIYKPLLNGELEINTQKGRALRLFVIVYNNEAEFINKGTPFKQWITFTKQHAQDLRLKKITIAQLIEAKVLEMVSPLEYANILAAQSYEHFLDHVNNPLRPFTHLDLPHSNYSLNILASPFINHSESVRTTYEGNQVKQTLGMPMLNYSTSFVNKFYMTMNYFEPIAKTIYNKILRANGASILLMIKAAGDNQEDSLIISESMTSRDAFSVLLYTSTSVELANDRVFRTPIKGETLDLKADSYSHLINGEPKRGTVIRKGMPLIGMIDTKTNKDESIIYKKNSIMIVDGVRPINVNGFKRLIVKTHTYRPVESGDKFSNRSGNKSIISKIEYNEAMPITKGGLVPDAIINPHAFPTRMVLNQIMESIISKMCAYLGITCDVSAFRTVDNDKLKAALKKYGIDYSGNETFYDDVTGTKMRGDAFICPTFYQRLAKMIKDNSSAVDKPGLDPRTQQKSKGINNGGGSRFGEMEKVVGLVIGSMSMLSAKMFNDSDGKIAHICNNCGNFANVNPHYNRYTCKLCMNDPKMTFSELTSSFGTFNFIKLMNIVGINITMKTAKPAFMA
jgi:DNA-directed RNA polymerase subunit B